MIKTAEEFIALRSSDIKDEYDRSAYEEAPIEVWKEILRLYPDYAQWVIHNKTVPLEILDELSLSDDILIRQSVASKRKLSIELFERLAKDIEPGVRDTIAVNKKTPLYILDILCLDDDEEVAKTAHYFREYRKSGKLP